MIHIDYYYPIWNDKTKLNEIIRNTAIEYNKISKKLIKLRNDKNDINMAIQQEEILFKDFDEVGKKLTKRLMELEDKENERLEKQTN